MKINASLLTTSAVIAIAAGSSSANAGEYYMSVFGGMFQQNDNIQAKLSDVTQTRSTYYKFTTPTGSFLSYSYTRTAYTTFSYSASFDVDYTDGWVVGAAVGRGFGENLRGELEVAFRTFDAESPARADLEVDYRFASFYHDEVSPVYSNTGHLTQTGIISADGDVKAWSFLANVWYDFDLGNDSRFTPFIGGGIGAANVAVNYSAGIAGSFTAGASSNTYAVSARTNFDDSSWVFAYQLGVGLGYDLGDGIQLSAQYRYFGTSEADVGPINQRVGGHNFIIGISIPLD